MKLLVGYASKHGSTHGIADAVAAVLQSNGHEVAVHPFDEIESVAAYDAVVLGSAVYAGHWLKDAVGFITANHDQLLGRPLWLFSSGPIGDPPKPTQDVVDAASLVKLTRARGHQTFAGRLDKDDLNLIEKAVVAAVHAKEGDFRDWSAVQAWAASIARELSALPVVSEQA